MVKRYFLQNAIMSTILAEWYQAISLSNSEWYFDFSTVAKEKKLTFVLLKITAHLWDFTVLADWNEVGLSLLFYYTPFDQIKILNKVLNQIHIFT